MTKLINVFILCGVSVIGCGRPRPPAPQPVPTDDATVAAANTASIYVSLAKDGADLGSAGLKADGLSTQLACAVPPQAAAPACVVAPDPQTGHAALPKSCLVAAGTVCRVAVAGQPVAELPLSLNARGPLQLVVSLDLTSGAAQVQQLDPAAAPVAAAAPDVPDGPAALRLASGVYAADLCPQAAGRSGQEPADFSTCAGHDRLAFYARFMPGSPTKWPTFDLWSSRAAMQRCLEHGRPVYQLDDGTSQYLANVIGDDQIDLRAFMAVLRSRAWLPAAALLRDSFANATLAPQADDGRRGDLRAATRAVYAGAADACTAFTTDLRRAWERADLVYVNGQPLCTKIDGSAWPATLARSLTSSPAYQRRCGLYRSGRQAYDRAHIVADCRLDLLAAAGPRAQLASDRQIVDGFLQALAALQGAPGPRRFAPLAQALAALPADLTTLDPSVAAYDTPLIAFLRFWSAVGWDTQLAAIADDLIAAFTTPIAPRPQAPAALDPYVGQTGRAVLLAWFAAPGTIDALNTRVCAGADLGRAALEQGLQALAGRPALAKLAGDVAATAWQTTIPLAQRCSDLRAAYADALLQPGLGFCPVMQLQSHLAQLASCQSPDLTGTLLPASIEAAQFTADLARLQTLLPDPNGDGASPYLTTPTGTMARNPAYTRVMAEGDLAALSAAVAALGPGPAAAALRRRAQGIVAGDEGTAAPMQLYALTQAILATAATEALHSDPQFRDKLLGLVQNSRCPFTASVGAGEILLAGDTPEPTIPVHIHAPLWRTFTAQVRTSPTHAPHFSALDQHLWQTPSCRFGERRAVDDLRATTGSALQFAWLASVADCPSPELAAAVGLFLKAQPLSLESAP